MIFGLLTELQNPSVLRQRWKDNVLGKHLFAVLLDFSHGIDRDVFVGHAPFEYPEEVISVIIPSAGRHVEVIEEYFELFGGKFRQSFLIVRDFTIDFVKACPQHG